MASSFKSRCKRYYFFTCDECLLSEKILLPRKIRENKSHTCSYCNEVKVTSRNPSKKEKCTDCPLKLEKRKKAIKEALTVLQLNERLGDEIVRSSFLRAAHLPNPGGLNNDVTGIRVDFAYELKRRNSEFAEHLNGEGTIEFKYEKAIEYLVFMEEEELVSSLKI